MNARAMLLPTPLAIALSLAFAGSDSATTLGAEASGPSLHYALRMSQRAQRNALRVPAQGAFRSQGRAPADTLPVTSCADDGSAGTLRSVIASASEGDVVDLSALDCSSITLTRGLIDLSVLGDHHINDLSIVGPGAAALTIDGNGDRVFAHGDFQIGLGTLAISNLTIANGNYTHGLASCIDSSGNVALTRAIVTGCNASGGGPLTFGGAVSAAYLTMTSSTIADSRSAATGDNVAIGGGAYVSGDATLIDATISGNVAIAPPGDGVLYFTAGGGLYVRGALSIAASTVSDNRLIAYSLNQGPGGGVFVRADAEIVDSTFDANNASTGGGLDKAVFSRYGDPGTTLTVSNSTFTGNGAYYIGGAIETYRPSTFTNTTIASNDAGLNVAGLACLGDDAELHLDSTILAKNHYGEFEGQYFDLGCNRTVTVTGNNNLVMTSAFVDLPADTLRDDPLLAPIADNGGPTRTMALDPASPAIDMGNNVLGLDYDQRGEGFARSSGAGPDIGAFEVQVPPLDSIFANGFD
jgi:hypothetical protein